MVGVPRKAEQEKKVDKITKRGFNATVIATWRIYLKGNMVVSCVNGDGDSETPGWGKAGRQA